MGWPCVSQETPEAGGVADCVGPRSSRVEPLPGPPLVRGGRLLERAWLYSRSFATRRSRAPNSTVAASVASTQPSQKPATDGAPARHGAWKLSQ